LGGVSLFGGWPFGPVVAFGAAAGEPSGLPRSGPLPAFMPVVLSRIPELVIAPLLPLVMPLVKVLPRTPACEVGWLCIVCCAIAVVPDRASRPTARVIFFIASSTERSPTDGFSDRRNMHPELIVCPSLPGEMGSLHLDPSGDGRQPGGRCSMLTANFWVSFVPPTIAWITVSF
jgi:hypothetical protein